MSEKINLPGEPRGERESIPTSVPTSAAPQSQASTQSHASPDTSVGTGYHHWEPGRSFPQAIVNVSVTPQCRWRFDATRINMDKKGIIQDLRKRKILHRPLHTSHPSFTNWAQSFCRNTKLSERLKWHDYFLLGLRFFFPLGKNTRGLVLCPTSCDR